MPQEAPEDVSQGDDQPLNARARHRREPQKKQDANGQAQLPPALYHKVGRHLIET
jgi:hypothetical protein